MEIACQKWECKALKLHDRRFNIDFMVYRVKNGFGVVSHEDRKNPIRNPICGFYCEVRCRNNYFLKYPTMILAEKKWVELKKFSMPTAPSVFLVSWTDCIGYVKYDENLKVRREWGGRNDMRDSEDVEPLIHIPREYFKIMHHY